MNIKKILSILFLFIAIGCYEDLGNYDYSNLSTIEIDTAGKGIKNQIIAYQFEKLTMSTEKIISYEGEMSDLTYQWSLCLQDLGKLPTTGKYDSAQLLSTLPNIDAPINVLPGDYYLMLKVKENKFETEQYIRFSMKVETRMSSGLIALVDKEDHCDLAMLQFNYLLPEKKEDIVYTDIYSSLNNKVPLFKGRFLGLYPPNLYIFTEDGGARLNANTYAVNKKNFKELFAVPFAIVPNPQAHNVSARPVEIIINNGLVYTWDKKMFGSTSFGDRVAASDEKEYYVAPYCIRFGSNHANATVVYDMRNYSFRPINQFGSQLNTYNATPEGAFDVTNIGRDMELLFMGNGFNEYTYSIFRERNNYKLYVADFSTSSTNAMPISVSNMSSSVDWNNASNYIFASTGNFGYFSIDNAIYINNYSKAEASTILTFEGEHITKMKLFEKVGDDKHLKVLIVATYNESENIGTIHLYPFNELNGSIDKTTTNKLSTNGKIIDFINK